MNEAGHRPVNSTTLYSVDLTTQQYPSDRPGRRTGCGACCPETSSGNVVVVVVVVVVVAVVVVLIIAGEDSISSSCSASS